MVGNVLQKEDNDWVKKCAQYKVDCSIPRGRAKRPWREVVEKGRQACKLNREDAMDHSRWRKMTRVVDD